MHLSQVKIKNFRLFSQLDLKLNRGLNVLVGENDSGKTALIDAIRYVLGTNSNDRVYFTEQDFHNDANELTIQLKLSEIDAYAHRFVEHLSHEKYTDDNGNEKRRSVLYVQVHAEKTGMERRGYPFIKTEVRSGVDGNGLAIEAEIREFLATTYLKPLRDAETELSSGRSSRLSQILSSSKDIREGMETILGVVARANEELLADDAALRKSADHIKGKYLHQLVFEKDKSELGAFINIAGVRMEDLANLPDHVKRRHLRAILEGLSLALTNDRRGHGLGYHNLLFMGAELLLLEQEASNEFPLLLIEEPEAHLHPQLQMKLLQFINSKTKTAGSSSGVQCILTTHSPNISSKADPSEVIMLSSGGAWSLRVGETELKKDDYEYLRKFLDATKANVFFARGIVFVEGDAENILLPVIARLLGRPLENYGVSVIMYDNSGSWKRFARLFLRSGQDDNHEAWYPSKICVLRDLDLWPNCAEELEDDSNPYGFLERKEPKNGRGGNLDYWEKEDEQERDKQIQERKKEHKKDDELSLERQRVKVFVSDRWTFEFSLARFGLFNECCGVLNCDNVDGTDDEKATFVQKSVSKTDFAYQLSAALESQLLELIQEEVDKLEDTQKDDPAIRQATETRARNRFAAGLRGKLPPYIIEAIEYVTAPIGDAVIDGEQENAAHA